MKSKALLGIFALLSLTFTSTAMAVEKGDWIARFGWASVNPKSDNHEVVTVKSASSLAVNLSYMLSDNLAIEVLGAYPFEHDISLVGGPKVASTEHLPPTVSVQWHFMPDNPLKPYVGLGVNYTAFFSTKTTGALADSTLKLGNSTGLAAEVGADIMMGDNWMLNLSARYIDIETKAKLDGASLGDVAIDPYVYTFAVGFKF